MLLVRKLTTINQSYVHFRRYLEIIDLLAKFGFSDLAELLHHGRFASWRRRFTRKTRRVEAMAAIAAGKSRPARVRLLLEALGPTFVKLGQVLASRPDLIPVEYAAEFERLQDHVPGFPGEEAEKIVVAELKKPLNELFRKFNEKPFAAASIGQVHRAVLKNGQAVVVKVQRPGIEEKIAVDLEIMYNLAVRLEKADSDFAAMRPSAIVEEFSHVLTRELNYMTEATHARRFASDMKEQVGIHAPEVYMDYTTEKVLTMELVRGDSCKDVLDSAKLREKYDLPTIARNGANAVMAQIFKYGFFHADPHPGNLFLQENNTLCFIDFGMMGRVTQEERGYFIDAVRAILEEDFVVLTRAVRKLAAETGPSPDWSLLERDLGDLVQENLYLPLDKLSLAHILEQLMKTMRFHKLALRPDLFVMFKSLMTIENVAREFDPKLSVLDMLKEAMKECKMRGFQLHKKMEQAQTGANDWWELGAEFPSAMRKVMQKVSDDSFVVKLEHHRLAPLEETILHSLGMLSCSVLIAALLMSASVVVLSGIPPKWHGVPLLGVAGYVLAAFGAAGLLLRRRKNPKQE